jgi:hypothetical protein
VGVRQIRGMARAGVHTVTDLPRIGAGPMGFFQQLQSLLASYVTIGYRWPARPTRTLTHARTSPPPTPECQVRTSYVGQWHRQPFLVAGTLASPCTFERP